jgi:hypothetical protein
MRDRTSLRSLPGVLVTQGDTRSTAQAFAIEAAGGMVGSAVGFGSVLLLKGDDCDTEDLGCYIETASVALVASTITSAAGTYIAGRAFDTRPSGAGAMIGALAGAAAGLGTWHLFTEELDFVNKTEAAALIYAITQGLTSALGSRIVRALQ